MDWLNVKVLCSDISAPLRKERACYAGEKTAKEKGKQLVGEYVYAHDLGRQVVVSHSYERPAGPAARQVGGKQDAKGGDAYYEVKLLDFGVELERTDGCGRHTHSHGTAGNIGPMINDPDDDELCCDCGYRQVEAFYTHGRHSEQQPDQAGGNPEHISAAK